MTRAGVPPQVAKQISGHKTDSIFNRYDIVDEDDMRTGLLKTQRHLQSGHNIGTLKQKGSHQQWPALRRLPDAASGRLPHWHG